MRFNLRRPVFNIVEVFNVCGVKVVCYVRLNDAVDRRRVRRLLNASVLFTVFIHQTLKSSYHDFKVSSMKTAICYQFVFSVALQLCHITG